MITLKNLDMSVLAPLPHCTSAYQNGGQRYDAAMEIPQAPPKPTQRRYTLHENFFEVLEVVGAVKDQEYEWKDVIMLFIRYLAKRKPSLLDPDNKSRVLCRGDPLGAVFGVDCFTKEQTRLLVRQHVSLVEDERLYASLPPLPPITGPCPPPELEPGKRGPAGDSADDPDSKRSRPEPELTAGAGPSAAPAVVPPPPSAAPLARMDTIEAADDGVGGAPVHSETDDGSVSCDDAEDHRKTYAREMEPVECTDVSDGESSSGESDFESPLHLTMLAVWVDDVGMMADLETSESDSENRDTWACPAPECQHANSAKKSKCDRCWKTRPAWMVGPRQRRKKRRQRDQDRTAASLSRGGPSQPPDSGFSSQETATPSPPPPTAADPCLICCEKPRDSAIIHGRTGCQVTCYGCARKLWKKRDLCPACRRSIEKIVFMRYG